MGRENITKQYCCGLEFEGQSKPRDFYKKINLCILEVYNILWDTYRLDRKVVTIVKQVSMSSHTLFWGTCS
jgi:hypothetical protein